MEKHFRVDYIHHNASRVKDSIREIVFGAEDGMVSTLGALTGIAVGTQSQYAVLLAGFVIVAVESISMSVGSFLSNKSVRDVDFRKLKEAKMEIKFNAAEEKDELHQMFIRDGWPADIAQNMASVALKDKELLFREMAYRELGIFPGKHTSSLQNSLYMFLSYIIGGLVPLSVYFIIPVFPAIYFSAVITILGLFLLGALTTRFTKQNWWRSGLEMVFLAGIASIVGYIVGVFVDASKLGL